MVYALADQGAQLLVEHFGLELAEREFSRKNNEAGRPFIEHQLEVMDFYVSLQVAVHGRTDIRILTAEELVAGFPQETRARRNPLSMRVTISRDEKSLEVGLVPDLIFGIGFPDGSRRCFMVEIDRGTMPVSRSDLNQTSFERKIRAYLAAHSAKLHEQQFGWKAFRVLTVTKDTDRARSIVETLRQIQSPAAPGPSLFVFAVRDQLHGNDPVRHVWHDGFDREVRLVG